jgi:Protein of unknown function (DUF3014)
MNRTLRWLVPLIILAVVAAALYLWLWTGKPEPQPAPIEPPRAAAPTPPAAAATEPPPVQHPIEQAQPGLPAPATEPAPAPAPLPPLAESDKLVQETLLGLVGRDSLLSFLNVSGYIQRFVVTVDNLPRKRAPVRLWPVTPTPGRFVVAGTGDATSLSAENFKRYEPFVRLVEKVDSARAVALYVRFYPLVQEAYQELGYPDKYFNDRLIEVIDHLLATPDLAGPVRLTLPRVAESIKLDRPWVLYEFADPELEARSAGQKMLIRMGFDNEARLKVKLRDLRAKLARSAPKQ